MKKQSDQSLIVFLAALCFFLSAIENSIPKPLPFLRLGLANAPIIFALFLLKYREYFFLVFIKILGQAIISGTLFSYIVLFSAGGSIASAIAMFSLQRLGKKQISCLGISLFGALANTVVQYFLARYLLFGEGAVLIAPVLLLSGIITGIALGFFSEIFLSHSQWFVYCKEGKKASIVGIEKRQRKTSENKRAGFRIKNLISSVFLFVSIVFFNLFQAYGKVLFSVFHFDITSGALFSGIKRASILTGMVFLSKFIVSSSFRLPGKWGRVLDHIFYYLAMLTEKKIQDEDEESLEIIEESKTDKLFVKAKKNKQFFSFQLFRAIDERLLEVYFS